MIIDQIKNFEIYRLGKTWDKVFKFIKGLKPDCEDKRHEIDGDDIFALVSSYDTKTYDEAKLEAHKKYIDIQILLSGIEIIECHIPDELKSREGYIEEKDIIFYDKPEVFYNTVILFPGIFALFFPQDAHMPGLRIDEARSDKVKKAVIKIRASLI